ncbi:Trk family potassium uptake protein [Falseniella ignava]|uniref:Trk family potassium uptake protein n=1 Tax=Falseniella ignava TaxID=137730 RepID=A0A2I1K4L9_9LACT|nr:TrkH family potassium uptake protein [Falseniella ignava]PKY90600.1 Trk family potassium uptake protein [Falseniella ignava]
MVKYKIKQLTIPQYIVVNYIAIILIGGILLALPFASNAHQWTNLLDAMFTATSAVCVTGQTTLNTALHWSPFGKLVIITLIEIGGIGFMTLWVVFFTQSGRRTNLRQRRVLLETLNIETMSGSIDIVKYIIKFTLAVQSLGALVLSLVFIPQFGWVKGTLYSVFHSISAFNNAGFDLFGNSLINYQANPLVMLTISVLIIAGGLGFIVWRDLLTVYRNRKLMRYTKLIIIGTLALLLSSTLLFICFEWNNQTWQHLSPVNRVINSFFLAVTPRTAGYANVDYNFLMPGSLFLTLVLMFIGGTSGSTAGGVKVSTVIVAGLFLVNTFRGHPMTLYRRELREETLRRAFFILTMGFTFILFATLILLITEPFPHGTGIEVILMEVVSCFSTVGLTMGITPQLSAVGKLVLIWLMFMGRCGLVTFLWSLGSHEKNWQIHYPEMNMMIG